MKSLLMETKQASGKLVMIRALFCLIMLAVPLAMHAQQYSGTITGTATDSSGASVPGADLTATNTGTAATYKAPTSDQGVYTFAQLRVGIYEVHVKKASFKEFVDVDLIDSNRQ